MYKYFSIVSIVVFYTHAMDHAVYQLAGLNRPACISPIPPKNLAEIENLDTIKRFQPHLHSLLLLLLKQDSRIDRCLRSFVDISEHSANFADLTTIVHEQKINQYGSMGREDPKTQRSWQNKNYNKYLDENNLSYCKKCKEQFESLYLLLEHIKLRHINKVKYMPNASYNDQDLIVCQHCTKDKCSECACGKYYANVVALQQHQKSNCYLRELCPVDSSNWQEEEVLCSMSIMKSEIKEPINSQGQDYNHELINCLASERFCAKNVCLYCQAQFVSKATLRVHSLRKYTCPQCKTTVCTQRLLKRHKIEQHGREI